MRPATVVGVNATRPRASITASRYAGPGPMRGERPVSWLAVTHAAPTTVAHPRGSRVHNPFRLRPAKPCPVPAGHCLFCERDPFGVTCLPKDVRGRQSLPHSWADLAETPDEVPDDVPCPCGTPVGGFHHWMCALEVCPWASEHPADGEQLLCCPCYQDDEP